MEDNPDEVARYRGGERAVLGFLVGQVMKSTKGQATPQLVAKMLQDKLDSMR